jgi:hypothetical protein
VALTGRRVGSWWLEGLVRPLVIAAMVACMAAPCVALLEWLWAGWDGTYLVVFAFFAALEGILSERFLRPRRPALWEYLSSRAAELLVSCSPSWPTIPLG